jgi:hypothetical protein
MEAEYPTEAEGWLKLQSVARSARRKAKGGFDVVAGISGGCDSSLALEIAVKLGLRVLAVHYDNGWNTDVAEHNMRVMTQRLDVPLVRYKINQDESDAIHRAFLFSGTRDFEAPTDIALTTVLYQEAERHGCAYVFNGHSFRTEGVAPIGWSYMDGRYIADVCAKHGGPERFDTFPNLWLRDFLRYSKIRRFRPLYYIDYLKEEVKRRLHSTYGWQWYDGHHRENIITDFFISWLLPKRWGLDLRILGWSALVRTGQMERAEALERLQTLPVFDDWMLDEVMRRLDISEARLYNIVALPKRTDADFNTYRQTFRRLRPLFWMLYRAGRVPKSFYVKYCRN